MEKQGMNRREFLLAAGSAAIAVPLAAALGGCGGGGGGPAASAGEFIITSTVVNAHAHIITITAADLAAGVEKLYRSSTDGNHFHTVTITQAQFNDINAGKTDNIPSSLDSGHTHDFPVKKS